MDTTVALTVTKKTKKVNIFDKKYKNSVLFPFINLLHLRKIDMNSEKDNYKRVNN